MRWIETGIRSGTGAYMFALGRDDRLAERRFEIQGKTVSANLGLVGVPRHHSGRISYSS